MPGPAGTRTRAHGPGELRDPTPGAQQLPQQWDTRREGHTGLAWSRAVPGPGEPPPVRPCPTWLTGEEGGRCTVVLRAGQPAGRSARPKPQLCEGKTGGVEATLHLVPSLRRGLCTQGRIPAGREGGWGPGAMCSDLGPSPGAASPPSEVPGGTSVPARGCTRRTHVVSRWKAVQPPAAPQPGAQPDGPRPPGPCIPRPPTSQKPTP